MSLDPVLAGLLQALPNHIELPVDWVGLRAQSKLMLPQLIGADGVAPVASVEEVEICGGLRVRIYRPALATRLTLVHLHGGGWTGGDLDTTDHTVRVICNAMPAVVVSCTYRLAPEHPFPAAFDDALAATRWALQHAAELGGDPGQVVLAGDSAGGNLVAAVTIALRDAFGAASGGGEPVQPRLKAQLLLYPAVDLRPPAREATSYKADRDPALRAPMVHQCEDAYLQGQDADNWKISPLAAGDLAGLPPALLVVLSVDPLRDQGLAYAERLRVAGVSCDIMEFPHLTHGFMHIRGVVPAASVAFDEVVARFRTMLLY
ncbi:MAG: alpha/beta hydrolase [Pseudomonadota bacterium]